MRCKPVPTLLPLCLALAAHAADGAPAALDAAPGGAPAFRCDTFEDWLAQRPGGDPLAGDCPTEGDCDVPDVRNGFLTGDETPNRWFRLHFVIFRADDGSDPAATEGDLHDQMVVMNGDFEPWRIQFTYTWEFVNDSTYRYGSGDSTMKSLYARDPASQCNVFVTNRGGGVGVFPWDARALTAQGGIIIGGSFFSTRHHVMTHEAGHNLGLWHTHHGVNEVPACSVCYERADGVEADETGDFCADTPPRPIDFGRCGPPGTDDPCSGHPWGDTQPENYMSYGSSDGANCWELFTAQQAARMHCWTEDVLLSWLDCDAGDDCNDNGVSDRCDIRDGRSDDANGNWIPDECESRRGDVDMDGDVDFEDLALLLAAWGPCEDCPEDLDGDGFVGLDDLLILLANWT